MDPYASFEPVRYPLEAYRRDDQTKRRGTLIPRSLKVRRETA